MRRLDSLTIKKIRRLRKQGKILEEIREETGVSLGAISKYCRRVKVDSARRIISSDPLEQELNAEVQDLAREAKRLGREVSIARMKHNIAEIKNGDKTENKIPHTENAFLKALFEVAKVDPARAKAILDSYSLKDVILYNLIYSGASD